MAGRDQAPNMEVFDAYFRRADLDQDGRISGNEAVAFFQGSNLPTHVLAQVWMHADQNRTGFLGRTEFYNALKLVTVAQSGRELTPDMVKAALFGPAATKIPAPQMNPVAAPAPQLNSMAPAPTQMNAVAPTSSRNLGFRGSQALPNSSVSQQFFPSPANQFMRPPQSMPAVSSLPVQGVGQGLPGGGSMAGPRPPNSNISTDWLVGRPPGGASVGVNSQVPSRGITTSPLTLDGGFGIAPSGITPSGPPASSGLTPSGPAKPQETTVFPSFQQEVKESKPAVVSGNGFSSDSIFGGDVFSVTPQPKPVASAPTISPSSIHNPATNFTIATGPQSSVKQGQLDPLQRTLNTLPDSGQLQRVPPHVKQNLVAAIQSTPAMTSNVPVAAIGSTSGQSQLPWPRITQSDIQKYTAVFVKVDTDRDGKITGEQARNLFLSWRLPREVLKQVWDLSDQDNDSMLTLREFCTALYLMERYREGRPLPAVLPSSIRFDETLLPTAGQPATAVSYGGAAWQPTPGSTQQGISGTRPLTPVVTGLKPPVVPGLKPPLQVSGPQNVGSVQSMQQKSRMPILEEKNVLNSKFQEVAATDKKVEGMEEILDSKEKIEFYRTKMQELVLYKSRCDNRLNEITERASADRREAESLAKKYEEKYKQVGEIASKLTVEEATFRDIQERKLELHNAIIKMEQGGSVDGLLQVRADRIQSDIEELVKALDERCKRHGIDVKPTGQIELPYGWQPGIQEGSVDWDEDWDKFEDEGFMVVKEPTIDVENVMATTKSNSTSVWDDNISMDEGFVIESSSTFDSKMEKPSSVSDRITVSGLAFAPSEDGSTRSPPESPLGSTLESPSQEYVATRFGKIAGEDAFPHVKVSDHSGVESLFSEDKYVDEHLWGATFSEANDDTDSIWGFNAVNSKESDHERNRQNSFFGSGDLDLNPIRTDSPNSDTMFQKKEKSPFSFADSVPGTPHFSTGFSPRYSAGSEELPSFDTLSRFDSFSVNDTGLFPPRDTLARFDSVRSTNFDHSREFPTFDDADPFGSSGPFKSLDSQTSRRGSDNWSAF
eukprot:TRINITY_DN2483_c0_g1_i1.p1 TRINITY_DN2483_c0_g1~~TRINITY_DN2483_c0_g1_i1.p1  ORF type:complete len:1057 (-),score=232.20 TRINITY_DN2483_c0_g1_i1:85-3255(-)